MKVAICDDDKQFLKIFKKQFEGISAVSSVDCFSEQKNLIAELLASYDVIFMDLDWGKEHNGIGIATELAETNCPSRIVFVTAYIDRFVQQVYFQKINVAGFLLKPVDQQMLQQCVDMIVNQLKEEDENILIVKENGRKIALRMADILYIESQDHYMNIYTRDREHHVPESLSELQRRLTEDFVRCHKGFIVNMSYIYEYGAKRISLKNQKEIPVGRKYSEELKKRYISYIAGKI